MADTNVIGDTSDYKVFIGDNSAGSAVYGMYLKPEEVKMFIQTPATSQELME